VNKGWLVNVSQKVLGVLPCMHVFMCLILFVQANQVWDDVGFGGKKGSIWSSPSAMKSMAILTDGAVILKRCLSFALLMPTSQANLLNSKTSNLLRLWHLTGNSHLLSHAQPLTHFSGLSSLQTARWLHDLLLSLLPLLQSNGTASNAYVSDAFVVRC
jgi:hypothetical protein